MNVDTVLSEVLKFLAGFISYGVLEKPSPAQLWPESGPPARAALIKDFRHRNFGSEQPEALYGTLERFIDYLT